jgi:hypothetical protein
MQRQHCPLVFGSSSGGWQNSAMFEMENRFKPHACSQFTASPSFMAEPFLLHEIYNIPSKNNYNIPSLSDSNQYRERPPIAAPPYNCYRESCEGQNLDKSMREIKMESTVVTQQPPKPLSSTVSKLLGAQKPKTQVTRQSAGHTCDRSD